jgi:hypothetical protein
MIRMVRRGHSDRASARAAAAAAAPACRRTIADSSRRRRVVALPKAFSSRPSRDTDGLGDIGADIVRGATTGAR